VSTVAWGAIGRLVRPASRPQTPGSTVNVGRASGEGRFLGGGLQFEVLFGSSQPQHLEIFTESGFHLMIDPPFSPGLSPTDSSSSSYSSQLTPRRTRVLPGGKWWITLQ
jgi:hypothetical protein